MSGIRVRGDKYIGIWCAGCKELHAWIPIAGQDGRTWRWDETTKTLTPSVRHFHPAHQDGDVHYPERTLCHYNVTGGQILYHSDSSSHSLRGDMAMEEMPPEKEAAFNWGDNVRKF